MNFIILPKPMIPENTLHEITFKETNVGGSVIGTVIGNPFIDVDFKKKLWRIRAKIHLTGIVFCEVWGRPNYKEYKRKTEEQKYKASCSKAFNERKRLIDEINKSSILFKDERILETQLKYEATILKLKERHGII